MFFDPEKFDQLWGDSLRAGYAKRDPSLGPLDIMASAPLAIGDHVNDRLASVKPQLALYVGGMGAPTRNFYRNVAARYGFGDIADRIQELYLAGKKSEATALVPDDLVRAISLVGPRPLIRDRLAAYAEAGVTTFLLQPLSGDRREPLRFVEEHRNLLP